MYKPAYFNERNTESLQRLIRENSFATLVSVSNGAPVISHLPFFLEADETSTGRLVSHMAKANPHWKVFEKTPEVAVIFQGPHAYISPAWYPPSPTNVPTWNYAVVHVQGKAQLVQDPERSWEIMAKLVESNENKYGNHWVPDRFGTEAQMAHIRIFEIKISNLDGKFKLSQQQDPQVRENVAKELQRSSRDEVRATGSLMVTKNPSD